MKFRFVGLPKRCGQDFGIRCLFGGDDCRREIERFHLVVKHGIRHSRLGNDWQDSFHRIGDFLTDFLFLSFPAKFQHAVVGGIAMDQMRCLISRRTALG